MPDLSGVPRDYWDLKEVFSKEKSQVLPPHREFDCAINLLPGATPPRGQLFALSPFEEIKARLTSPPVLQLPDPEEPFVVEVDAL